MIVDTYISKDNYLVVVDKNTLLRTGINKEYINNNSLNTIKKLNSGTKIKRNSLLSLDELLKIWKNKLLIINLIPTHNKDNEILNKIAKLSSKYNNLMLISQAQFITDKLLSLQPDIKVGIFIDNPEKWKYSFDFYVASTSNLDIIEIKEKIKNKIPVFITEIKNVENLSSLKNKLNDNINNIYFISNNIELINNDLKFT